MSNLIGNLPYFSMGYSDWHVYCERLEQYFEVNDIDAEKRRALLLTSLDETVYKTLRDVCHPSLPKERTYDELLQLLSKQFVVRTSVYRERVSFYTAKQERGETIATWFARLKKLSVDCKFGEHFDAVLLDRFISGLRSSVILDRLCEEDESLTLQKAVDIATSKESSAGADLYADDDDVCTPMMACGMDQAGGVPIKKRNHRKKKQTQQQS